MQWSSAACSAPLSGFAAAAAHAQLSLCGSFSLRAPPQSSVGEASWRRCNTSPIFFSFQNKKAEGRILPYAWPETVRANGSVLGRHRDRNFRGQERACFLCCTSVPAVARGAAALHPFQCSCAQRAGDWGVCAFLVEGIPPKRSRCPSYLLRLVGTGLAWPGPPRARAKRIDPPQGGQREKGEKKRCSPATAASFESSRLQQLAFKNGCFQTASWDRRRGLLLTPPSHLIWVVLPACLPRGPLGLRCCNGSVGPPLSVHPGEEEASSPPPPPPSSLPCFGEDELLQRRRGHITLGEAGWRRGACCEKLRSGGDGPPPFMENGQGALSKTRREGCRWRFTWWVKRRWCEKEGRQNKRGFVCVSPCLVSCHQRNWLVLFRTPFLSLRFSVKTLWVSSPLISSLYYWPRWCMWSRADWFHPS